MTHLGYIAAAYGATVVILAAVTAWVALDLRAQKAKLARLEQSGRRAR